MFHKFFGRIVKADVDDEFNDVEIVNGRLIKKNQVGKNGEEDFEKVQESIKESCKVLRSEENFVEREYGRNSKIDDYYEEEITIKEENIKEDKQKDENEGIFLKKKGRVKGIDGFFIFLESAGRGKKTIETYKYAINWWQNLAEKKGVSIYTLKIRQIEEAIAGMDINTKKKNVSALKQVSKWYLREGYPELNIETQKIVLGRGKARIPKAKSLEEFKKIREHGEKLLEQGKREGIWLLLMITCGCRIGELETVSVGEGFVNVIGKGNKERRIPCGEKLINALNSFKAEGSGGYRSKRQVVDRCLRGMGYVHLHSLRHTYATILHNNGLNLEEVSKLLGHADISTTQVYAQTKINEGVTRILDEI